MKRFLVICAAVLWLSITSIAQDDNPQNSAAAASKEAETQTQPKVTAGPGSPNKAVTQTPAELPAEALNLTSAKGFVLEDDTPVRLRLNRTISSSDSHVGDTVDFVVVQDISVNGVRVVPKGGFAFGKVTKVQSKRSMARGGKLEISLDYVNLLDSEKAALRAIKGGKGGGHVGYMTAGIVATGVVFFPAAFFVLTMQGKDYTIPKGAELTAYINGDVRLDIAKFQQPLPGIPPQPTVAANAAPVIPPGSARLLVESTPPGADIELDGGFIGHTPFEVQVTEGEHTIAVKKAGFKDWQRKMKVSGGSSIHMNAELEHSPPD